MRIPQSAKRPLFLVYCVFITILFCLPGSAFPSDTWMSRIWLDKWVHVGIFSILVILFALAFPSCKYVWILLICAIYGLLIEFLQNGWIPNRSFDLGDWLADLVGIMVGMVVYGRYVKK